MRKSHDAGAARMPGFVALAVAGMAVAAVGCLSSAALARPLVPAEHRFDWYLGRLPSCADPAVFARIQSRFHQRESEFWKSGLEILGFDAVREIGMRTNGLDYIPRRYCVARVLMNNQAVHKVSYSIIEDMGIIGLGFGVDWCVAGFDRNYAYAPDCRMALP